MSDITPFPPIQEVALPGDPAGSDGAASPTPDGPRKLKGRERLLRRLSRISSSPTLAQLGRSRSSSSPYRTQSSLSCVSLAQAGPSPPVGQQGQPCYFSQNPKGFMTPTSTPTTPGLDTPFFDSTDAQFGVRKIDLSQPPTGTTTPLTASPTLVYRSKKSIFNLFHQMPYEVKIDIFGYFSPKELVRLSRVNKEFYKICFDGQLWKSLDASEFYQQIPADSLAKIIVGAGPFVQNLNLRGCVHLEHYKRAETVVKACENLMSANLEGCRNFARNTLLNLVKRNTQLTNLNLTGLVSVTNSICKAIAQHCPQVEVVNVSWCKSMDTAGIKTMVEGLPKLRDLRACEIMGFDSLGLCELLFRTNNLERLVLSGCTDINDTALRMMLYGRDPEIDILTDRPVVPPRKLRHLDLTRCSRLTSNGVKALGHFVPDLEGLQLGGCTALTDAALEPILATTPRLTHLDLEELADLTNNVLAEHLAKAPCAPNLEYLSISYCENLGDVGMLPVMRACKGLRSVDMDNTRVSDLVLAEAAAMVRARSGRTQDPKARPSIGLNMVVYDCQNVTWTGAKEILHRNAEMIPIARQRSASADEAVSPGVAPQATGTFSTEIIGLKCYYGWQMTVDEHTKRVLRGDRASAVRLERKWADYMQATEELGAGAGRRRRRRARETAQVHADEEEGPAGRRWARTTACIVM